MLMVGRVCGGGAVALVVDVYLEMEQYGCASGGSATELHRLRVG